MEKITTTVQMVRLVASEGHYLANKDNDFYCREVYLGKGQTADNWHEITADEAKAIDEAHEAKRKEAEAANRPADA